MPVVLASALAYAHGVFAPLPAFVALLCAVLMQIASNLINDLYDFRKGADTAERLGPPRAVASGRGWLLWQRLCWGNILSGLRAGRFSPLAWYRW
jgi:4-hydroxybenzoate polyprenyltransferase